MEDNEPSWQPPVYDSSRTPALTIQAGLIRDPQFPESFARSAKWCSDGSLALAHCENRSLQYLDLPPELLDLAFSQATHVAPATRAFPQAAPILDFIWYPRATPRDPSSFCFVASVRESPVRLLDASDGRLRASYKIVDHRERQIAPHSLAFNLSAERLYCGFEDAIEVFDLNYPGEGTRLATTPSRKSKDGLKGIISALAFCPSYDPSYSLYAAGSLSPSSEGAANIALFGEDTGDKPVGWVGDGKASVTQLAFNPMQPHVLYASFRRQDDIYSYDLRGDTSVPLQVLRRSEGSSARTNQKLRFDIDLSGKWLSIGNQQGDISMFDLGGGAVADESLNPDGAAPTVHPTLVYHAHDDAVGSVAFHPLRPVLLSVSGSRHFDIGRGGAALHEDSDTSSSDEEDEDGGSDEAMFVRKRRRRVQPLARDASCKLWNFEASREVTNGSS